MYESRVCVIEIMGEKQEFQEENNSGIGRSQLHFHFT